MSKATFQQMIDGVGVSLRSRRVFQMACCDCGLVHDMVVVPGKGGWFGLAVKRNKKATNDRRKEVQGK